MRDAGVHHSGRGDPEELHEVSYLFPERAYTVTTTRHMINIFCIIAFTLKDHNDERDMPHYRVYWLAEN